MASSALLSTWASVKARDAPSGQEQPVDLEHVPWVPPEGKVGSLPVPAPPPPDRERPDEGGVTVCESCAWGGAGTEPVDVGTNISHLLQAGRLVRFGEEESWYTIRSIKKGSMELTTEREGPALQEALVSILWEPGACSAQAALAAAAHAPLVGTAGVVLCTNCVEEANGTQVTLNETVDDAVAAGDYVRIGSDVLEWQLVESEEGDTLSLAVPFSEEDTPEPGARVVARKADEPDWRACPRSPLPAGLGPAC